MFSDGLRDGVNSCGLEFGQRLINFYEEVEVLNATLSVTVDIRHLGVDLADHQWCLCKQRHMTPNSRAQTAVAALVWGTDLTNHSIRCQWAARCADPIEIGVPAWDDPEFGVIKNIANCACGLQR
jgi:hypothetical protein